MMPVSQIFFFILILRYLYLTAVNRVADKVPKVFVGAGNAFVLAYW